MAAAAFDDPLAILGPLVFLALALYVTFLSNLLTAANQWLPRTVDAVMAAISVVAGIVLVVALDGLLPFKLYDPKMMTSAVVFCTNPTPPPPHAFVACTASGFVAGVVLHYLKWHLNIHLPPDAVAVGLHLLFSKLSGNSFSAAVGLTAFVGKTSWAGSWSVPLTYLGLTWISGHALLYGFAHLAAVPRRAARLYLTRRQWAERVAQSCKLGDADDGDARLRELFRTYDTSGDGRIDAAEFRIALRALTGCDVPQGDCEATLRVFDVDGSGTIDFAEFCQAIAHSQRGTQAPPVREKAE